MATLQLKPGETIIARATVAPIHPKAMPAILHDDDEARWLTGTYDEACALAQPYPSQLMTAASYGGLTSQTHPPT